MDLEQRFAFLDALPESLFNTVVTTRHGELDQRVSGILQWRNALLQGRLPAASGLDWPVEAISGVLLPRLDAMELPALCADQEVLTDHLLETLCVAVDSIDEWRDHGLLGLFDDILKQNQRRRDTLSDLEPDDVPDDDGTGSGSGTGAGTSELAGSQPSHPSGHSQSIRPESIRAQSIESQSMADSSRTDAGQGASIGYAPANQPAHQGSDAILSSSETRLQETGFEGEAAALAPDTDAARHSLAPPSGIATDAHQGKITGQGVEAGDAQIAASLQQQWQQLIDNWRQTEQLVSGMGTQLGRGWDLSQGRPRLQGWREFVALRRWIKAHPELIALVNSLGRSQPRSAPDAQRKDAEMASIEGESSSQQRVPQPVRAEAPSDTRGITRSDEIARMLPQEAAFLGHPVLKGLWHARRSEQALLTYQVQGVMSEHRLDPVDSEPEPRRSDLKAQEGRGPIMVCLDTSASMHGEPETLAKAVCLEVLRLANQQQRDCLLFAFSGPGQIMEMALSLRPGRLRELIAFLQQSFAGGTDIAGPLRRALRRSREQRWQRADLLLISDGRFPVPGPLMAEVDGMRLDSRLRIRGISIGRWSGRGMELLCDSVLKFDPGNADRAGLC